MSELVLLGRAILVVGRQGQRLIAEEGRPKLLESPAAYTIFLLEAEDSLEQVKQGLRSGADDFIFQPTNDAELILRVGIGERILNLKSVSRELPTTITAPKFHKAKSPSTNVRI